jgi:hypothetical protein
MKLVWPILLCIMLVSAISIPIINDKFNETKTEDNFFFGVSFGGNTTSQAKLLIDKVKGYTNFFLINNWDISTNETALNEICEYAFNADLHFIVFFDYISYYIYPWHVPWMDTAIERWGSKFLGIYIYEEPGGRQIDWGRWNDDPEVGTYFENVSDYSEAADRFVTSINYYHPSISYIKNRNLSAFTSDYALYWFDYLAGYDTVFVELGWNHNRTEHIALGRGAGNVQDKDWGVIIVWNVRDSEDEDKGVYKTGPEMLEDMKVAYQAGAKYVIVFDFPYDQPYGILEEEHFVAMEAFWDLTRSSSSLEKISGEVAFVLPKDYGWGMRRLEDRIWGLWGPDELSQQIWDNMNKLIDKYGLRLDIIYNDTSFDFTEKYSEIYYWNSAID